MHLLSRIGEGSSPLSCVGVFAALKLPLPKRTEEVSRKMNGKSVSTVALFGLPISNVSMAEAVERIANGIEEGTTQQIATANLDFARNARKNSFLHQVICDCSLVLPDGAPMLWASWLLGRPLKQRVTGVDLIPELAKLSAER